jgi:hypothetical protein
VGGSGASGSGGAPQACVPGNATVVGTIGENVLNESYPPGDPMAPFDSPDVMLTFGGVGRAFLRPTAPPFPGQVTFGVTGMVDLPASETRQQSFVCAAGPGSLMTVVPDQNVPWVARLRSLSQLGGCPGGTPVEGEVNVTLGSGQGPSGMTSTLQGASFAMPMGEGRWTSNLDHAGVVAELFTESPMGTVIFAFEQAATAPVAEGAYLIVPDGAPDAGAVYCAGSGSGVTTSGTEIDFSIATVSFRNLTRLGACPATAVAGSLDLCGG